MSTSLGEGEPFGIRWDVIDGNDPVNSWKSQLSEIIAYIRTEQRRPFVLEAMTSRLHGHSSSSGAARVDTTNVRLSCSSSSAKLVKRKGS